MTAANQKLTSGQAGIISHIVEGYFGAFDRLVNPNTAVEQIEIGLQRNSALPSVQSVKVSIGEGDYMVTIAFDDYEDFYVEHVRPGIVNEMPCCA